MSNFQTMEFHLLDFLLNSQTKQELKKISSHIAGLLYTEFYLYIWLICIYNVLLFVLILSNLALTIQLLKQRNMRDVVYMTASTPFIV